MPFIFYAKVLIDNSSLCSKQKYSKLNLWWKAECLTIKWYIELLGILSHVEFDWLAGHLSVQGNQCWLAKEHVHCKYNQPQGNKYFFKKRTYISKGQVTDLKNIVKQRVLKVISFSNSILCNFSGFTVSIYTKKEDGL